MDAIRYASTPLEAMCAVAILDTKSLPTEELVWVRKCIMVVIHLQVIATNPMWHYTFPNNRQCIIILNDNNVQCCFLEYHISVNNFSYVLD